MLDKIYLNNVWLKNQIEIMNCKMNKKESTEKMIQKQQKAEQNFFYPERAHPKAGDHKS
jgi:hypothetical protein